MGVAARPVVAAVSSYAARPVIAAPAAYSTGYSAIAAPAVYSRGYTAGYYGKREAEAEPEADAEAQYSTYGYNNYGYSGLGYSAIARPSVYSAGYSTIARPVVSSYAARPIVSTIRRIRHQQIRPLLETSSHHVTSKRRSSTEILIIFQYNSFPIKIVEK